MLKESPREGGRIISYRSSWHSPHSRIGRLDRVMSSVRIHIIYLFRARQSTGSAGNTREQRNYVHPVRYISWVSVKLKTGDWLGKSGGQGDRSLRVPMTVKATGQPSLFKVPDSTWDSNRTSTFREFSKRRNAHEKLAGAVAVCCSIAVLIDV